MLLDVQQDTAIGSIYLSIFISVYEEMDYDITDQYR